MRRSKLGILLLILTIAPLALLSGYSLVCFLLHFILQGICRDLSLDCFRYYFGFLAPLSGLAFLGYLCTAEQGWGKALAGYYPILNTLIGFVGMACTPSGPGDSGIGEGLFMLACLAGHFSAVSLVFVIYAIIARRTYFKFNTGWQKAAAIGGVVLSTIVVFTMGFDLIVGLAVAWMPP